MESSGRPVPTKIALLVEYSGGPYCGFQTQPGVPTVQDELERALWKLTRGKIRVVGASRTDSGVHATGQVVSFRAASQLPVETFVKALNHYLPMGVSIRAAALVGDGFDARRSALSREYRYTILNRATPSPLHRGCAYLVTTPLDVEALTRACQVLVGRRDLAPFAAPYVASTRSTLRTIYKAEVQRNGELVMLDMTADSFLPQQVRRTVGALVKVGLGKTTVEEFHRIALSGEPGQAGPVAPACGLCLMKVNYGEGVITWRTPGEDLQH